LSPREVERLKNKYTILKGRHHPALISVFDIYEDSVHFIYVKETFNKIPLAEYIKKTSSKHDENDIRVKMTPVFAAIAQCHDEGYMHGDLCI
jgi:serine/threonine protein kinase